MLGSKIGPDIKYEFDFDARKSAHSSRVKFRTFLPGLPVGIEKSFSFSGLWLFHLLDEAMAVMFPWDGWEDYRRQKLECSTIISDSVSQLVISPSSCDATGF